jgi:uncharacterized membrane protein required for colicin V production
MANWIDVLAVIAVAFFVFYGIQKGVMKTCLDVFAVLLAVFFAGQLYRVLSTTIMPFLKVQDASVYAITFIIFWIIGFAIMELFAGFIMKLIHISFIGYVETLGGGLLGLIQGILIAGITIQLCLMLPLSGEIKGLFSSSFSKKVSVPTLTKSYSSIFSMFPKIDLFIQEKVLPVMPSKDNIPQVPSQPKVPEKLRL